jgi:SAM-dependent methyltransferase/DNA-binding transcriptional ArsR family regulator
MMKSASLDGQLALLGALGDATRLRLCALLSSHELSVLELTHVLELGQSKVSTHLARLREQDLVLDRKAGTSSYYRLNQDGMPEATRRVWQALRESLADSTLERDQARAAQVVAGREHGAWPERVAGELERHYSPGRTWESLARSFAGLVRQGEVLDIGAGDGTVAGMLAARAKRYVCVDISQTLLRAADKRLRGQRNLGLLRADMQRLPFPDARFDLVLSLNVLAYAENPGKALDEAARVLRPGGELLVVTLKSHDQLETAAQYGHRHPGFEPRFLRRRLGARGLSIRSCDVSAREPRRPHFEVISCFAQKE